MRAVVRVEVFPHGKRPVRWRARYLDQEHKPTKNGVIVWGDSSSAIESPAPALTMTHIERLFAEKVSPWEVVQTEDEKRAAREKGA